MKKNTFWLSVACMLTASFQLTIAGETAKEKPQRGRVLAVGPGKLLDSGERAPIGVVEGDEVLFGKYSGTEIKVDGEEIKILRESDILAKIVK